MARCDACGDRLRGGQTARCECGATVHASCREYHAEFDCEESGERWIGAVEF